MSILHLTSSDFDTVIGNGHTLVDFWASWCGPCKMVAPVIEQLAEEYDGKMTVAKVDVDAEGNLAMRYNVRNIPTVVLFADGAEVRRFVGAQPIEAYKAGIGVLA
ncbi:MAG: thioredoxin [Oscillospiraceae bacterium]|nr:thioredoxin [Oscillospiraceae bacterium]